MLYISVIQTLILFLVSNGISLDTGQLNIIQTIENDESKSIKDIKKKITKDETEQPIYPCEECILCFTTNSDLRVSFLISHFLCI